MPISAHIVLCAPEDRGRVLDQLRALPGVEAGAPAAAGIPVVTDTPTERHAEELGTRLGSLAGVRSAVLVYHNFEDVLEPA